MLCGSPADGFLLPQVHQFLEVHVPLLLAGGGGGAHDGSAVHADEQFPLFQYAEVLTDGDFRNTETFTEFRYVHRRIFLQYLKDSRPAALRGVIDIHWKQF